MNHSTGSPTKSQQERFRALTEMGCICCLLEKNGYVPPQIHHLVDKGYRSHSGGHDATLPLCPWHHEGQPVLQLTTGEMKRLFGPSMKLHKREFVNVYGSERELLTIVDERLTKRNAA